MIVLYCDGGAVQFDDIPEGTAFSYSTPEWPDAAYMIPGIGEDRYAIAFKHWATLVAFRIRNKIPNEQWVRL